MSRRKPDGVMLNTIMPGEAFILLRTGEKFTLISKFRMTGKIRYQVDPFEKSQRRNHWPHTIHPTVRVRKIPNGQL